VRLNLLRKRQRYGRDWGHGSGIPAEIKSTFFEPFFTTKDVGKGTGLGLGVSYRIIAGRHSGDIHVESRPGDTRFQVRLPIRYKAD
jgi:signal transduction histidine kinase